MPTYKLRCGKKSFTAVWMDVAPWGYKVDEWDGMGYWDGYILELITFEILAAD